MSTLTTLIHNGNVGDVPLMTSQSTGKDPSTVITLGLRAVWLHLAVYGPGAPALTPRDRDALTLVATSAYGAHEESVILHLRRGGATRVAASACTRRLVLEGYLSYRLDETGASGPVVDLPLEDLYWIAANARTLMLGDPDPAAP